VTAGLAPRWLAAGLAAAAIGVAAVAAPAIWASPRLVAWRWRDDFHGLRVRCTAFFPGPEPGAPEYAALRLLALERTRSPDPKARCDACTALIELADRGAAASPAQVRAVKAALAPLLGDGQPVGDVDSDLRRKIRVCDCALAAAGRPGCVTTSAELTDRACADARAEIERELAGP
jgi:hypothetical protein